MLWFLIFLLAILLLFWLLFFTFWKLIFLRNPTPTIPNGNVVVSPAEGKIVNIIPINKTILTAKKGSATFRTIAKGYEGGHFIQIMLNIHNIHYQRAPTNGDILSIVYTRGSFKNAVKTLTLEALENERNEIVMQSKDVGNIKIIQLAGFVARRIECFVKKNQNVKIGQVLGRINLGSQVCILLPKQVKLSVRVGEKVEVAQTVIGVY